jgi:hypothetical protein
MVTEAQGFALIAVLALAGWTWMNIQVSRAFVPMANAQKIHQQIVEREDAKVQSLAERALRLNRGGAPQPQRAPVEQPPSGPMADLFRPGTMSEPIMEQPDAHEVEIVDG